MERSVEVIRLPSRYKPIDVVIVADLHCGSRAGLTSEPQNRTQEILLEKWEENIDAWGRPDILIVNGDAVEGKGKPNPTLTQHDGILQAQDSFKLLKMWDAKTYLFSYGTNFHTANKGGGEDWEYLICSLMNEWKPGCAQIRDYWGQIEVGKTVLYAKHKVDRSSVPHGKATPVLREAYWGQILSMTGETEKKADIYIFSHVHYFLKIEDDLAATIITPAWQARGSKYGNRKCSATNISLGSVRLRILPSRKKWYFESFRFHIPNQWAGKFKLS
jgi:hypothetical protein